MNWQRQVIRISSILLCIILLGITLGSSWNVHAQEDSVPVEIVSTDDYDKTIEPKSTATYNWTLVNNDINNTFGVEISKSLSELGWTANLNQDYLTLEPESTWIVVLSVTPPKDMKRGELKINLNFNITNKTGRWYVELPPVLTEVYEDPKVMGLFDNPLPSPLDNKYGVFLLDIIIWTLIVIIAYLIFEQLIHRWTKKTKTELDDIIFKIIRSPVLILMILYGIITSLEVLDLPKNIVGYVEQVYFIVLIIVVTWVIFKLFKDILIYYGKIYAEKTESQIDDILIPVIEKVGAIIIVMVAVTILLAYTGIDLTMLAVGSIVISMVIAFALQDTISNFFSGIYILTDRPFKVDDLILLESGEVCKIEHIGMRSTRLYNTLEHTMIIMPNNKLANDKIVNYTEPDTKFRISVQVGVAYGTDPDKIIKILLDIVEKNPNLIHEPEQYKPSVRFSRFADSSLNFELVVWINDVEDRFDLTTKINKEIDRKFKEENIEIPFPQRVVWMKDVKKSKQK
ncbi:MAG: mechanosensitive ion channel [Thermoplasmata archaeon]|nr:MAG: mechanosensitive ion channel [Thermoplasmata archaeon]